jgi:hypothetical protein
VRPVVLKGTRLPRLRPLLHESAELAEGRFEAAKQSAMRKNEKRGRGVHCRTKCLGARALMVLAMVHARSTARPTDRSGRNETAGAGRGTVHSECLEGVPSADCDEIVARLNKQKDGVCSALARTLFMWRLGSRNRLEGWCVHGTKIWWLLVLFRIIEISGARSADDFGFFRLQALGTSISHFGSFTS